MVHAGQLALAGLLVAGDLLGSRVVHVGPERGYLDHLMLAPTPVHHMHDAKAPADDEGAPEKRFDFFRRGGGGHVEILGPQAQQQVAHRAADDIGLMAGAFERLHHIRGASVHQRRVDAVLCGGHFGAFAE